VISALASETSIRSRTEPGENPPKTTLCGAPIRAQAVEIGVGDGPLLALFAVPVVGHPVSVARLDVPVHTVVGDVELAVGEPLVEGWVGVVQHRLERLAPVQLTRATRPVALGVGLGVGVDLRVGDPRGRPKALGGLELLHLHQLVENVLELLGILDENGIVGHLLASRSDCTSGEPAVVPVFLRRQRRRSEHYTDSGEAASESSTEHALRTGGGQGSERSPGPERGPWDRWLGGPLQGVGQG
jgi:hypothetical protein